MGNQKSKNQPELHIAYFCKQLSLLVKSGINIPDAMAILHENAQDKTQKAIYAQLTETVKQGMPLAAALTRSGHYPAYMTQMVQIGETSGKLDEVLEALYVYYERTERINRGIKNVVTYPIVMVCVMLAVIAVLLVKAVPIFAQVFQQVGAEIPNYLQSFASDNAARVFLIVIAAVAAGSGRLYVL
jgi:type IV pilus assembly protein PilC